MEYKYRLIVRFNECDMYGHVNHAVYLNYLECARLEMMKSRGISVEELAARGYRLFIVHIAIRYKNSALFNDELEISTSPISVKKIGGKFKQIITAGDQVIVEAEVQWACIDNNGRPVCMPEELLKLLI